MSNTRKPRPAFLKGGIPTVRLPEGASSAPLVSEESIGSVNDLLRSVGTEGASLGDLGPWGQGLEESYAALVGRDRKGRKPKVFAVPSGSVGLAIAYAAMLTLRYVVERRPMPQVPNAATSVWSCEPGLTAMPEVGVKPVLTDVDINTGCTTAAALESVVDPDTAFVAVPALYDHGPPLEEIRTLCDDRELGFVLDAAHGPMFRRGGKHAAAFADITVVSGSKIGIPGLDGGLIVVFDPMLGAIIAKMRNHGRAPQPPPGWWPSESGPEVPAVAGYKAVLGEIPAILLADSFERYRASEARRRTELDTLRRRVEQHPELPWRMLPGQQGVDGIHHMVGLIFEPAGVTKERAWRAIGHAVAARMLAEQLLTEVSLNVYPMPWDPSSRFHPDSRPWIWGDRVPDMARERFNNARYLSTHIQLLPGEFLAGEGAADQAINAMLTLDACADDREVQNRAGNLRLA